MNLSADAPPPSPSSPSRADWHVRIQKQTGTGKKEVVVGPIGLGCLRDLAVDRAVDAETLVWHAGLHDWCPLATNPELSALLPPALASSQRAEEVPRADMTNLASRPGSEPESESAEEDHSLVEVEQRLVDSRMLPTELLEIMRPHRTSPGRRAGSKARFARLTEYFEEIAELPDIYPSREVIDAGGIRVCFARKACPKCDGIVRSTTTPCSCWSTIVFAWAEPPPRGAVVQGRTSDNARVFRRLAGPHLAPLGQKHFGGLARFTPVWTLVLAIAGLALLGDISFLWRSLQRALADSFAGSVVGRAALGLALAVLLADFARYWFSNRVRAAFGRVEPWPRTQAGWLLTRPERIALAVRSARWLLPASLIAAFLISASLYRRHADGGAVVATRAALLERLGQTEKAALLFDRLASRDESPDKSETARIRARRLWESLVETEMESGAPQRALPVLKRLIESREKVGAQESGALGRRLVQCAQALLRSAINTPSDLDWDMARQAVELVSQKVPNDPDAVALTQTSNWQLAGVVHVWSPKRLVYFRGSSHEAQELVADEKSRLVVADLQFVHTGTAARILHKQAFTWKPQGNESVELVGFREKDEIVATLRLPDERLGPELVGVSTIWKVARNLESFSVAAFGAEKSIELGR